MQDGKVLKEIHNLDKKIDVLTEKVEGTFNERLKDHDKRLIQLEQNQRWVALAVIGACIIAVMTLILKKSHLLN